MARSHRSHSVGGPPLDRAIPLTAQPVRTPIQEDCRRDVFPSGSIYQPTMSGQLVPVCRSVGAARNEELRPASGGGPCRVDSTVPTQLRSLPRPSRQEPQQPNASVGRTSIFYQPTSSCSASRTPLKKCSAHSAPIRSRPFAHSAPRSESERQIDDIARSDPTHRATEHSAS